MLDRQSRTLLRRNPVFRNFLCATTVSLLGSCIFDIAMPLFVLERTHSAYALALTSIGLTLPYFLMAPLAGFCVDNYNKRRILIISDVGQVVCLIFLYLYERSSAPYLWPILAAVFATKSFMILFETVTTFQLIPALVATDDLTPANTWVLSSHRLIQVFGPVAGGVLLSAFGVRSCILVNLFSFAATLYFSWGLKNLNELINGDGPVCLPRAISFKNLSESFRESLVYIWQSPIFRPFVGLMFLWNFSPLIPGTPTFAFYFSELKHFTSGQYGFVVSLSGVLGVCGYFVAGTSYKRQGFTAALVNSCFWQALLGTISVCLFPFPIAFAVVFALSRSFSSVVTMGTYLLRQTQVPRSRIGGVNACLRMLFMISSPISSPFQAFLIEHFGAGSSFAVGALCLWGMVWFARAVGNAYEGVVPSSAPQWRESDAA